MHWFVDRYTERRPELDVGSLSWLKLPASHTSSSTGRTSTPPSATSILGRRPRPEERPRWERLLQFAQELWGQPAAGLFFLAANSELPMPFVQALMAIGYRPVPLSGAAGEKVVDIAIQRTLVEIRQRRGGRAPGQQ